MNTDQKHKNPKTVLVFAYPCSSVVTSTDFVDLAGKYWLKLMTSAARHSPRARRSCRIWWRRLPVPERMNRRISATITLQTVALEPHCNQAKLFNIK